MMKRNLSLFTLMCCAALVGCGSEPEPVAEPTRVTPSKKLRPAARVIGSYYKATEVDKDLPDDPNALIPEDQARAVTQQLRAILDNSDGIENHANVVATIRKDLQNKIKEADQKQLWSYIPPYYTAYKLIEPNDKVYAGYLKKATDNMSRPKIRLRGFMHDHGSGQTTAILELYDQTTREKVEEKFRMGETQRGITFVRVIGKDEGVEIAIAGSGQVIKVMKGEKLK